MSQETSIEWTHPPGYTGATWNPVTGCTKIASGCKNCYAETIAKRFWKDRKFTDVQTHPERLDAPLRRRKPTCYFVNSMSDLFHDAVPFEFIAAVYGVMAACPQNLFIILTKRPKRMREFFEWLDSEAEAAEVEHPNRAKHWYRFHVIQWEAARGLGEVADDLLVGVRAMARMDWPLPNVIHGYSAASQADLDAGIGDLRATPSAKRCLSLEPLVGPIDLNRLIRPYDGDRPLWPCSEPLLEGIDWALVGGESGPGARPCDIEWIRRIVAQCKAAGVRCFVKQIGSNAVASFYDDGWPMVLEQLGREWPMPDDWDGVHQPHHEDTVRPKLGNRKGADPSEWPQEIRVREYPEVARG